LAIMPGAGHAPPDEGITFTYIHLSLKRYKYIVVTDFRLLDRRNVDPLGPSLKFDDF
jgi:hypothetical protein